MPLPKSGVRMRLATISKPRVTKPRVKTSATTRVAAPSADREAVAKGRGLGVHAGGQVCFSLWRSIALRYSTGAKSSVSGSALPTSGSVAALEDIGKRIAEAVLRLALGGDPLEFGLVLRRPVIGEDDDVALALEEDEVVEGGGDGGDRAVEQHGRRLDVLHHHAARVQALGDQFVELVGQEVERDEGAAIGVDHDDIELAVLVLGEPHPPVHDLDVEIVLVADREELVGDPGDGGVELDRGHLQPGYALVMVPGGPAAAEADDRGAVELGGVGEARRHRLGIVDGKVELVVRVDDRLGVAEPLGAEGENVEAVRSPVDVDVVVEGLDLGDDAGLGAAGKRDLGRFPLPEEEGDHGADHDQADDADQHRGTRAAAGLRGGLCGLGGVLAGEVFARRTWLTIRYSLGSPPGV